MSEWSNLANAPRDGTMVLLLVRPFLNDEEGGWTPFDDSADPQPTIGFNNLTNTGEDRWQFAGWCWSHDHFRDGQGEVLGWAPFEAPSSSATAHPQAPRLARLMKLEAALGVARRTIVEGGGGGVSCTVWVPKDVSPAETLVDHIDAALEWRDR